LGLRPWDLRPASWRHSGRPAPAPLGGGGCRATSPPARGLPLVETGGPGHPDPVARGRPRYRLDVPPAQAAVPASRRCHGQQMWCAARARSCRSPTPAAPTKLRTATRPGASRRTTPYRVLKNSVNWRGSSVLPPGGG